MTRNRGNRGEFGLGSRPTRLPGYTINNGKSIQCIIFCPPVALFLMSFFILLCHERFLLKVPIVLGRGWWGGLATHLAHCFWVPRKIHAFVDILAFLQRWWWRYGRWWKSLIAFPHYLSLSIICGHSHSCGCTQKMTTPFRQRWGGVTPKQFGNISGRWSSPSLTWKEWWWVLSTVPHPSLPTPHLLCQILFENRKVGDVGNDYLLSVDGTDFCVVKSYKKPFYLYKFNKLGFCYKVALCIKTGDICWWAGPYLPGIWNNNMIFQDGVVNFFSRRGRGVRRMTAIRVVLWYMQNVLELLRQTPPRQRCSRGWETVRRRLPNGSKTGQFCPPLIATSCLSTRQSLVPLFSLLSFRLQKTHCSKKIIMISKISCMLLTKLLSMVSYSLRVLDYLIC